LLCEAKQLQIAQFSIMLLITSFLKVRGSLRGDEAQSKMFDETLESTTKAFISDYGNS